MNGFPRNVTRFGHDQENCNSIKAWKEKSCMEKVLHDEISKENKACDAEVEKSFEMDRENMQEVENENLESDVVLRLSTVANREISSENSSPEVNRENKQFPKRS